MSFSDYISLRRVEHDHLQHLLLRVHLRRRQNRSGDFRPRPQRNPRVQVHQEDLLRLPLRLRPSVPPLRSSTRCRFRRPGGQRDHLDVGLHWRIHSYLLVLAAAPGQSLPRHSGRDSFSYQMMGYGSSLSEHIVTP